jgi:hypothetical protein
MEIFIKIFAFVSWGFLCFAMGRMLTVNKALTKQWGDQKEFQEWKNSQPKENNNFEQNNYENGRK